MSGYGSFLSQDAKDASDLREQQIAEIRQYIQKNPEDLQAIAEECAESPEYIEILLSMSNTPITKILAIYNAMQTVQKGKAQQADKLQQIKDFIKPKPTVIFDLSSLSGLSPQEVADVVEEKDNSYQNVTILYGAIQQMLDAKTEETINKFSKK